MPSTINHRVVLGELLKSIRPLEELVDCVETTARTFMKSHRTIGYLTARKSGKSRFFTDLVEEGDAVIVYADSKIRDVYANYVNHKFAKRFLTIYEVNEFTALEALKDKGIKYLCFDDTKALRVKEEVYDKIIDAFGLDVIIIKI